jgi:dihydrofolate synthase / folylpolyglutamate synthase
MNIRSLNEAEEVLERYMPLAHEIIGKDITLERMIPLMASLGNPERKLKIIHVAGTSGKTSTSYYIASLLQAAGQKVGLTVSPHLDKITERVQVNLTPLNDDQFCHYLGEFVDLIIETKIEPSYFELLIAFVYWLFDRLGVDYVVADNEDKVCVITDIGLDHMHVLGHTIPEIALQKAGIIHAKNEVVMHRQSAEVMAVIETWIKKQQAHLNLTKDSAVDMPEMNLLADYQKRNWSLAYAVFKLVQKRDGLPELSREKLAETMLTYVPGRMEVVNLNGKTIIMDGAHNTQKMAAFISSFQKKFPGKKASVLMAMKKRKDYHDILPLIKNIVDSEANDSLIFTTFKVSQDLVSESVDIKDFAKAAQKEGLENFITESNLETAYNKLINSKNDTLVITGSLYLLSQIRKLHKELHA